VNPTVFAPCLFLLLLLLLPFYFRPSVLAWNGKAIVTTRVSRVLHAAAAATPLIRPFNSRDRVVIIIMVVVVVMATSVSISVDDLLVHGSGRRRHGSKADLCNM
jgi:hypothetical protein